MKIQTKRFVLSLVGGLGVFLINVVGMYREGFVFQYYWIPETLHIVGGFCLAMCIYSLGRSVRTSVILFTTIIFSWELMEYSLTAIPSFGRYVGSLLEAHYELNTLPDTLFDIALGYTGGYILYRLAKRHALQKRS